MKVKTKTTGLVSKAPTAVVTGTIALLMFSLAVAPVAHASTAITGKGTFLLTITSQTVIASGVVSFTFSELISGDVAGTRVGSGILIVHPDGTFVGVDSGTFTGSVAGISGTAKIPVIASGTFGGSFTATGVLCCGTGLLEGVSGIVSITGAFTSATTLAGTYSGVIHLD